MIKNILVTGGSGYIGSNILANGTCKEVVPSTLKVLLMERTRPIELLGIKNITQCFKDILEKIN